MVATENILVFTQARLGSQRLPQKMIKDFGGTTLWDIACKKLEELPLPHGQKWVSLYEEELLDIASKYRLSIHRRSKESATCDSPPSKVWEICRQLSQSHYVMFNPCLPFLKTSTIENFIKTFVDSKKDSMFGVVKLQDYIWDNSGQLIHPNGATILNTKECPPINLAAHCLYAGKSSDIRQDVQLGDFSPGNPELFYLESKVECLDVDDQEDWDIAEAYYKAQLK